MHFIQQGLREVRIFEALTSKVFPNIDDCFRIYIPRIKKRWIQIYSLPSSMLTLPPVMTRLLLPLEIVSAGQ